MNDQLADSATDPIDPTETSAAAFLSQHDIVTDGELYSGCICGWEVTGDDVTAYRVQVVTHLFNASRSSMYRESAAILQAERANVEDDYVGGLQHGFSLMLARADAAELPDPGAAGAQASTGSV